ncbi:MAG: YdcF family protein [Candidatus Sedimenticola sp. (ex Thyasira tokunagai)]
MEQEIVWTLKTLILPPGVLILAGLFGLTIRQRFFSKLILLLTLTAFYLLSTHYTSNRLLMALEHIPALTPRQIETTDAEAIVVLGGGRRQNAPEYGGSTVSTSTLERVRYAAHLARTTGLAVIPTGGSRYPGDTPEAVLMRSTLEKDFQVKVAATEEKSRTTRENAEMTAPLLRKMGIRKVLLVTHALHMPRSLESFERVGIDVISAPTGFEHTTTDLPPLNEWLPSAGQLHSSSRAVHEYLGRWWYRLSH